MIDLDDHGGAIEVFVKIVNLARQDVESRKRLAELYMWKEWNSEALYQYEQILKITPDDPLVLKRVAELYSYQDRDEEAIPIYERLAAITPGDRELLMTLYNLYIWSDRLDKGLDVLKKVHEKDPDNPEIKLQLAQHYLWMDREAEAILIYEVFAKAGQADAELFKRLGELYEWNDRPADALKMYGRYLELKPWDSEILRKSAALSIDLGLKSSAMTHLKAILRTNPSDSTAREVYDQLAEGVGSNSNAAYTLFMDNNGFYRHRAAAKFFHYLNDFVSFDVYYAFQYFKGKEPVTDLEQSIYSNGGGGDLYVSLPAQFSIQALASGNYYEKYGASFNGGLIVSKDFAFPMSVGVYFLREDNLTTIGAIQNSVVENRAGLEFFAEPIERIFIYGDGGYGILSDENRHFYVDAGLGVVAVVKPSLEFIYEFSYDAYKNQPADASYFAPDGYQVHALGIYFSHAVNRYFSYGWKLRPWYAVRDEAFLLTYGAGVDVKPHRRHLIKLE
ncbi:MAG: hypothetical protein FJ088_12005, partial [Deltaproteobacteria bacterium]|nr:hypothetical protein [Deltaproteobacteria bacterium]